MDGEEQGEGQEANMYTHYNGTHNNVARNSHHRVRRWEGPTGAGGCRMVCM